MQLFITMRCNLNCSYCIQKGTDRKSYKEVEVDKWIELLLEKNDIGSIGLIGGEPTIYKGFKEFIEKLHDKYLITVTSNLKSSLFDNFEEFLSWSRNYRVRWNLSFHPEKMDVGEFINKIRAMRFCGLYVDQVAGVDSEEIRPYLTDLCNSHIGFYLQTPTYLDSNGILHPTKLELAKFGSGEALINDINKYNYLCGGRKNETVICNVGKLLVDPEGNIYRCHRDLYKKENSIGNVFTKENIVNMICPNPGECNPCDLSDINYWRI